MILLRNESIFHGAVLDRRSELVKAKKAAREVVRPLLPPFSGLT